MPKLTPKRLAAVSLAALAIAALAGGWTWDDGTALVVLGWKWGR